MRLNIGNGSVVVDGWVHADCDPMGGATFADLRGRLPWPDDTFDAVVANHVLQMVGYLDLAHALGETRRVLRSGGVLRVLVPDVMAAFDAYRAGNVAWFPARIVGDEATLDGLFSAYLTWYGTARTTFTARWLVELLLRAGFATAMQADPGVSLLSTLAICELDSREGESIVVEARK